MVAQWSLRQCLGQDEVRSLLLRVHTAVYASELTPCTPVEAPNKNQQLPRCNVKCRNPYNEPLKEYFLSLLFPLLNNKTFTVTNATWFNTGINWRGCFSECSWIMGTERCQTLGWWNINELQPLWEAREVAELTSLISSWQWIFLKQHFNLCASVTYFKP